MSKDKSDLDDMNLKLVKQCSELELHRRHAVAETRNAMAMFGAELVELLESLPKETRETLGLEVKLVCRGPSTIAAGKLQVEVLPALDEDGFDTRPGATALYLNALGVGKDRQYVERRVGSRA